MITHRRAAHSLTLFCCKDTFIPCQTQDKETRNPHSTVMFPLLNQSTEKERSLPSKSTGLEVGAPSLCHGGLIYLPMTTLSHIRGHRCPRPQAKPLAMAGPSGCSRRWGQEEGAALCPTSHIWCLQGWSSTEHPSCAAEAGLRGVPTMVFWSEK